MLPRKERIVSMQEKDANIFLRKAIELTRKKNYKMAYSLFQDALNRYTEIDDEDGKTRTLSGLVKLFAIQGDKHQADSICSILSAQPNLNKTHSIFYTEAIAFNSYQSKELDKLLALFNQIDENQNNLEIKSIVASYVILCSFGENSTSTAAMVNFLETRYDGLLNLSKSHLLQNIETTALAAYALAINLYSKNEFERSAKYIATALDYDIQTENSRGIADDYYLSGKISFQTKKFNQAIEDFHNANDIYSAIGESQGARTSSVFALISEYKVSGNPVLLKSLKEIQSAVESKELIELIKKYISEETR